MTRTLQWNKKNIGHSVREKLSSLKI